MLLRHLELTDFRSYEAAALDLERGPTVIVGANAHGKTNLLEAVNRLAVGASHRVAGDTPLVRAGRDAAYVRATCETDAGRRRTVEVELRPGSGTRAKVDGQDVRRTTDAVGVVRAVLAAPEDLEVLRGDPGGRRRLLDDLLSQRRPAYAALLADYNRVLRQRNQLLRSARGLDGTPSTLVSWTEQLVGHGARIVAARVAAVTALRGPATEIYGRIADRPEPITLTYRDAADRSDLEVADGQGVEGASPPEEDGPSLERIEDRLRAAFDEVAAAERERGVTLVGPHRDDLDLAVSGLPSRGYASHGQLWSLVLALRFAAADVIGEVGDRPVLLLDDVFAELDDARRHRLADLCAEQDQVLVTAAVEGDVPMGGRRLDVGMSDGRSEVTARVGESS